MKCEAAGTKWLWKLKCERVAIAQHDGKSYCMLHLPREHPQKTYEAFDKALVEDLQRVRKRREARWDLRAIVSPDGWYRPRFMRRIKKVRLWLDEANLSGASLERANMSNAELVYTNLSSAYLLDAILIGANLGGADLSDTWLKNTDLSSANLLLANLTDTKLENATIANTCISHAEIDRTDLGRANLGKQPLRAENTQQLVEGLLQLRNNLLQHGRQDKADEIYLLEQRERRKLLKGPRKWLSYLFDWVAEYGNKPGRVLSVILGVFAFFGLLHMLLSLCGVPLLFRDVVVSGTTTHSPIHPLESFYFSIVAFTTLGFGDIAPLPGLGQILAGIEVTMGAPLMALFVFCLGRKSLR